MIEIENEILKAFVESVSETLETMAMMELAGGEVSTVDVFEETNGYTASMGLCGENEGLLIISFGEELGRKIVSGMLGEEPDELDEESLVDGVGEVANMVAGGAKTRLSEAGIAFDLSIPAVMTGEKEVVRPGIQATGLRVDGTCEGHPFVLALWNKGISAS